MHFPIVYHGHKKCYCALKVGNSARNDNDKSTTTSKEPSQSATFVAKISSKTHLNARSVCFICTVIVRDWAGVTTRSYFQSLPPSSVRYAGSTLRRHSFSSSKTKCPPWGV